MMKKFNRVLDELCYDYDEILLRQDIKQEWVDSLREMAKRSQYVPKIIHDKQLAIFVNGCGNNTEKSSKWMHVNYKLRSTTPEFFDNRLYDAADVKDAFEVQTLSTLPFTPDNFFVFYFGLRNTDPKRFNFDHAAKTFMMMVEAHLAKEGPRKGVILIYDLKGTRFNHIFRPSIHSVRKALEYLQGANPLVIKSIHVLNSFWFMDLIFAMIKPFVKKEYYELIHLHPAGSEPSEVFFNDVPKSHLPSDLGGDMTETTLDCNEKTKQLLEELKDYFEIDDENTKLRLDQFVDSEEYKYRDKYF